MSTRFRAEHALTLFGRSNCAPALFRWGAIREAHIRIGYCRSSASDQDFEIQRQRLIDFGCEVVRAEKASGKARDGRDELAAILDFVRNGDEIVVVRLDRLGRNCREVLNIVHELDQKGGSLRVLEPDITTAGDIGRMVVTILGMVAEVEYRFIKDRQLAGISAAKARGVYKGRKKKVKPDEIAALKAQGLGPTAIARQIGVTPTTVHRELNKLKAICNNATEEWFGDDNGRL